jgi:hypothetical protein
MTTTTITKSSPGFDTLVTGPETTFTAGTSEGYSRLRNGLYEQMIAAQMTAEIDDDPMERNALRRARQQIREGVGRWLGENENPSDAID